MSPYVKSFFGDSLSLGLMLDFRDCPSQLIALRANTKFFPQSDYLEAHLTFVRDCAHASICSGGEPFSEPRPKYFSFRVIK